MLVKVNPGAKITYIPPDYSLITRRRRKDSKLRVAAYCRVSSKNNNQEPSLENQVKYFTELIRSNKKWYFSGVFTDIKSGRNSDRPGLNKLFKKCERGKVDRVIIKSMSRFTRNTLDAFVIIRYLTSIGVDVFFEKENIHTLYQRGELIFSIYAALGQFKLLQRTFGSQSETGLKISVLFLFVFGPFRDNLHINWQKNRGISEILLQYELSLKWQKPGFSPGSCCNLICQPTQSPAFFIHHIPLFLTLYKS